MDNSLGKFAKLFNAGLVFYVGNDKTRTQVTVYITYFFLFLQRQFICISGDYL